MRSRQTKPDSNQNEIVVDLRQLGAQVWITQSLGGETPDLIVLWQGTCGPVEIKAIGRRHDLTDGEIEGMRKSAAVGVVWIVAETAEDVIEAWSQPQAWSQPRWRIVDQHKLREFNKIMGDALELAVKLTRGRHEPLKKKQACDLRDAVFKLSELHCEAVEFK